MPGSLQAWYSFHDLAALGDREAILTDEIEVADLTRLAPLLHAGHGRSVAVSLRCGRTPGGGITLELSVEARLSIVCQRCLEPFEHPLEETVQWVIAETESVMSASPAEAEPLVLEGGRLRPAALLEDELIVSLPMVPRHATIDECGALAQNLRRVLTDQGSERTGRTLEVSLGD